MELLIMAYVILLHSLKIHLQFYNNDYFFTRLAKRLQLAVLLESSPIYPTVNSVIFYLSVF